VSILKRRKRNDVSPEQAAWLAAWTAEQVERNRRERAMPRKAA
jgi:hypothetical protein